MLYQQIVLYLFQLRFLDIKLILYLSSLVLSLILWQVTLNHKFGVSL
jgi:hypothetical protein